MRAFFARYASSSRRARPLRAVRVLNSVVSRSDALNLVQHGVDVCFGAQQLRKRDVGERVVDDLVQLNDHWSNAAISGVHARIEDARVTLAMRLRGFAFEHSDHLIQMDFRRWFRERITAFDSTRRLHKTGFTQNPQQLTRVCRRDSLELGNLRERQRLADRTYTGEL